MFYNRTNELAVLENEYLKSGSAFTVIYGRRRIGKTALITEYIRNKPAIFYYATEGNIKNQLDQLTGLVLRFFEKSYLENVRFDSFEQLFIFISEHIGEQKIVFVIDEYQQLVKLENSLSSILQKCWDLYFKSKNIHIILCGSLISMMYSETLDYSSPLYGRRTSSIHLKGLRFKYIPDFIPAISKLDQMQVYASFGTVPKYLETYQVRDDFITNIKTQILNKNAYLYNEVRFLLKEEIRDTATYFSILETIAGGEQKIGKIGAKLGVPTHHLSRYMQKLADLDIIEKEIPVTENEMSKSKLGRYRIKDQFIRFWFYFVYRNYSYLEINKSELVLKELENNFNEKFVAIAFEEYVKEQILDEPEKYLSFIPFKIGRWWNNKEEIDLVAFDEQNVAFIECKWQTQKTGYSVYSNLKRKSEQVQVPGTRKEEYVIFSKNGFKESLKEANCRCFQYL